MPIRIPNDLPAASALRSENIFVMTDTRAKTQDIRPLKILLLNLMPTKIATETQLARLLGNTPIQVEMELLMVKSHVAKNTSEEHMLAFYKTFDQVCGKTYDGMAFEDVEYWDELCAIFEWTKTHVTSTFHICWGAQAGLYYHWGVPKYMMEKKLSGVYRHRVVHKNSILFRGFDDTFMVPHSRYTTASGDENPRRKRRSGRVCHFHPRRTADFHHRSQRIRRGHAGEGVPARQSRWPPPRCTLQLLSR